MSVLFLAYWGVQGQQRMHLDTLRERTGSSCRVLNLVEGLAVIWETVWVAAIWSWSCIQRVEQSLVGLDRGRQQG